MGFVISQNRLEEIHEALEIVVLCIFAPRRLAFGARRSFCHQIQRWVEYLQTVDRDADLMLAPNSRHCWSQWVYHTYAELRSDNGDWRIDLDQIPERAWSEHYACEFTLKLPLPTTAHVAAVQSDAFELVGYEERYCTARLSLAPRNRSGGKITCSFGSSPVRVTPGAAPG